MRLPDAIERDLQSIETEYAQRGGQQAGTPRLRGLRASIEIELQRCNIELALFHLDSSMPTPTPGHEAILRELLTAALRSEKSVRVVKSDADAGS